MFAPEPLYPSENAIYEEVLPALRELLSRRHPRARQEGPGTLSKMLYAGGYLSYRPELPDVEAAREALLVDEQVEA